MKFNGILRLIRKVHGFTQKEVAERLGITINTYSKWELGKSEPTVTYIRMLCDLFSVSADELLFGRLPIYGK